jgi:hypothetical protein
MNGWRKITLSTLTSLVLSVGSVMGQSRSPAQAILPEEQMVKPNKFEANIYQKYVLNEKQRLDTISQQVTFWNSNDSVIEKWGHIDSDAYYASVTKERTEFLKTQLTKFFLKSAGRDVEGSIQQNLDNWKYSFSNDQNAKLQEDLLNKDSSQEFSVDQAMYQSLMKSDSPDVALNLQKKNGNNLVKEFKIKTRFHPLRGLLTSTMEFRNSQMSIFAPINGRFEININNLKPFYGFNAFTNFNVKDQKLVSGIGRELFYDVYLRYTFSKNSTLTDKTISLSYAYNF